MAVQCLSLRGSSQLSPETDSTSCPGDCEWKCLKIPARGCLGWQRGEQPRPDWSGCQSRAEEGRPSSGKGLWSSRPRPHQVCGRGFQ